MGPREIEYGSKYKNELIPPRQIEQWHELEIGPPSKGSRTVHVNPDF